MIFPVIVHPRKEKYKEVTFYESKIVNVDCKVYTSISFDEEIAFVKREMVLNNQSITYLAKNIKPPKTCAFFMNVRLSADEYKNNHKNLEEYVCGLAKQDVNYQAIIDECVAKEPERKYVVVTYLPKDPDTIKINTIKCKCTKLVPVHE